MKPWFIFMREHAGNNESAVLRTLKAIQFRMWFAQYMPRRETKSLNFFMVC